MLLGWLCLDQVRRERTRHSTGSPERSGLYEEKPLMLVPTVLGVLLLLGGLALPVLAVSGRIRAACGLDIF